MTLRLLAVHAHPDDESSKGAGTYARYAAAGAEVLIVSCTGGERGDVLNEAVNTAAAKRDLAALRRTEMALAQKIIGCKHLWLGYQDSGLPAAGESVSPLSFAGLPLEQVAAPLVRIVRAFKPHVLITYNENGGYPHPDHIRCHEASVFAYHAAADSSAYPELGEPWEVTKLYYDEIFNAARVQALHHAAQKTQPVGDTAQQLAALYERFGADSAAVARAAKITTKIDVSDYLEVRDAALRAHASQVEPDHKFFFIDNELQRKAWPTEDFRLAASRTQLNLPETDLFAGITAATTQNKEQNV